MIILSIVLPKPIIYAGSWYHLWGYFLDSKFFHYSFYREAWKSSRKPRKNQYQILSIFLPYHFKYYQWIKVLAISNDCSHLSLTIEFGFLDCVVAAFILVVRTRVWTQVFWREFFISSAFQLELLYKKYMEISAINTQFHGISPISGENQKQIEQRRQALFGGFGLKG